MYGFQLGREFKLSIAEIFAVFPEGKALYFDKEILILDGIEKEKILKNADFLGGTIKIFEIGEFDLIEEASKHEGKFKYGISIFGQKKSLKEILNKTKNELKKNGISSRFVNKDFKNLNSAQILGEKLVEKGRDYNFIFGIPSQNPPIPTFPPKGERSNSNFFLSLISEPHLSLGGRIERGMGGELRGVFGKTIWIQNINNYSKRDFGKGRDMQTGMLPPKLAQMMINFGRTELMSFGGKSESFGENKQEKKSKHGNDKLQSFDDGKIPGQARNDKKGIFDPFVGLGTILIEASLMGFKNLYGSDLNEKMLEYSKKNLEEFLKTNNIKINEIGFEKLNAKFIDESKFISKTNLIVTEGYLGEIMTQKNISLERINKQRESLKLLYERFFENLGKKKDGLTFGGSGNKFRMTSSECPKTIPQINVKKSLFSSQIDSSKINFSPLLTRRLLGGGQEEVGESLTIIISFPFWELNGKYIFFEEIYEIIKKYCKVEKLFPEDFEDLSTKAGSLLYKREKQLVGREIFKLRIK